MNTRSRRGAEAVKFNDRQTFDRIGTDLSTRRV